MQSPYDDNPYSSPSPPTHEFAPVPSALPQPNFWWAVLAVIGFFVFQFVVAVAVVVVGIAAMGMEFLESQGGQVALVISGSASTCVYAIALAAVVYRPYVVQRIALCPPTIWQTLFVVLLSLPLAVVASEFTNWLMPYIPSFNMQVFADMSRWPLPLVVIGLCLFPAVGEEILLRGFIGRGLVGRWGPVAGVAVTSIIFGAIHIDPLQAISACLLGVALHYVYLTTKSLLMPMLLHFLNNLGALLSMRYSEEVPIPGVSVIGDAGEVVHTPAGVMLTSCALVAALLALLYQCRSYWALPDGRRATPPYTTAETPLDVTVQKRANHPNPLLIAVAIILFGLLLYLLQVSVVEYLAQ